MKSPRRVIRQSDPDSTYIIIWRGHLWVGGVMLIVLGFIIGVCVALSLAVSCQ